MSLISKFTTKTVTVYQPIDGVDFSEINHMMAADSYFPIVYKVSFFKDIFNWAALIWIIVFTAVALMLSVLYISTLREIRDAEHFRENVYYSNKVTDPAVYGVIKPKIVLPEHYRSEDIKYVLHHENSHIRRCDNLWRLIGFLTAALHWFNPLSWAFLKLFLSDLELACDECVLSKLGEDDKKDYANSLLEHAAGRSVFVSAFGGAKVRTRIKNILSFKKLTALSAVSSIILFLAIFYLLLTNAG